MHVKLHQMMMQTLHCTEVARAVPEMQQAGLVGPQAAHPQCSAARLSRSAVSKAQCIMLQPALRKLHICSGGRISPMATGFKTKRPSVLGSRAPGSAQAGASGVMQVPERSRRRRRPCSTRSCTGISRRPRALARNDKRTCSEPAVLLCSVRCTVQTSLTHDAAGCLLVSVVLLEAKYHPSKATGKAMSNRLQVCQARP